MFTHQITSGPTAGTVSAAGAVQQPSDLRAHVLADVAGKLRTTQAELTAQLRSGRSITEVAQAAGVTRSAVVDTIKGTLGGPSANALAGPRLDAVAQQIADSTRAATAATERRPAAPPAGTPPVEGATLDVRL